MSLIPEDKLKSPSNFNFAPMIDFLFLMLAFFATLAVSRASLYDTKLSLAQLKTEQNATQVKQHEDPYQINLSITQEGNYKWITDIQSYTMNDLNKIKKEISYQHSIGLLPKDKNQTHILLHIDKNAAWEPIAKLIFAIREEGFEAFPVYEPEEVVIGSEK
ncbi:MAG: biopolymer transporter ExbD [Parachlamydiales bacterium]|nr:biopolymer transporter ExbD [Parachlamydiales bacterium]